MTLAVAKLARVLAKAGVDLSPASRKAMEAALEEEDRGERRRAATTERRQLSAIVSSKIMLRTGNTKEDVAVRNVLYGLVSEFGRRDQ